MKKQIKVGDYVRIKYMYRQTKIAKITKILEKDPCYHDMQMYEIDVVHQKSNGHFPAREIYEEDILDYSSDIKELVYEGDLIRIPDGIFEVIFDKSYEKLGILVPNKTCLSIKHSALEFIFSEYKDVGILTKENFDFMNYVIKE